MADVGAGFPNAALACALRRAFATDLLVVDADWLAARRAEFSSLMTMLRPVYEDDAVSIFRLDPSPATCPAMRVELGTTFPGASSAE